MRATSLLMILIAFAGPVWVGIAEVVVRARHKPRGYDGVTKRATLPK